MSSAISAFISIKDEADFEPPRARVEVIMSPSRVTTRICGWLRSTSAASPALLTTAVALSNDEISEAMDPDCT